MFTRNFQKSRGFYRQDPTLDGKVASMKSTQAIELAKIRASLTGSDVPVVRFTRMDGEVVSFYNVRVESIGPSEANRGVIAVKFIGNEEIIHVPFVESWRIEYVR